MLTRPSSDSRIDSRSSRSSSSLSPPLHSQPLSPLSPLSLASTASLRSSSSSPAASDSPASPSPMSPSSPTSPSISHLFPSLPPTFTLHYLNSRYTVHPLLLSHHSAFFHSLLTTPSPPTSFTLSPHNSITPSHVLLLLQTLYTPPPSSHSPPSSPSHATPFTPLERQLIAYVQPLLLLAHLLEMPLVLGWLDALLQRCLEGQLRGGEGRVGGGKSGKGGFVMGVWGMGLEYGLEGVARRAEEELLAGGWGRWWEGAEWKEVEGEVSQDVRERMVSRGKEVEAAGQRSGHRQQQAEQHSGW